MAPTLSRASVHRSIMVAALRSRARGTNRDLAGGFQPANLGHPPAKWAKRSYGAEVEIDRPGILKKTLRTFNVAPCRVVD